MSVRMDIPSTGLPAPSAANWFHFSHHGGDIQLLVGYIDLYSLASQVEKNRAKQGKGAITLKPEVTHRVQFSVSAFLLLRGQIDEMFQKLKSAELIADVTPTPSRSEGSDAR